MTRTAVVNKAHQNFFRAVDVDMSSSKQQTYRRLMKEVKGKSAAQHKKIDHPLSRYNALGQLSCIVCQQTVKSELLWGTHLQTKRHKENVAALRSKKDALQADAGSRTTVKRKPEKHSDGNEEPSAKKSKVATAMAVEVGEKEKEQQREDDKKTGLPSDFFDSNVPKVPGNDEEEEVGARVVEELEQEESSGPPPPPSLPSDFFDKPKAKEEKKTDHNKGTGSAKEAIPEGFFDDPKLDAKARKVEYKDRMEEEWEMFQKSIQKESDVSEAIQLEEDEEAQEERDLTEVQEQVECFQKAETLRVQQERLLSNRSKDTMEEGPEGSGEGEGVTEEEGEKEEEEGDEEEEASDEDEGLILEMNWRSKHS